jgi:hypothetical protein
MNRQEIKKVLDDLTADIDSITDKKAVAIIKVLINLVEMLVERNMVLEETNRRLIDEINRLKGEQGKPKIRKGKKDDDDSNTGSSNHSSEDDRNKRNQNKKPHNKNNKKDTIRIDKYITVEFDKTQLPDDAVFKGFETRVIQDLKIITDNIEFKLPTYYSPLLKKTFIAPLPLEYQGSEFGPGIRSLVITLYRDSGMTEPAIERFLHTFGIQISRGTISSMLTEKQNVFHQEKEDIIEAGRQASTFQHLDDTGCRVNGQNHYMHVLCSPFFTAYFTRRRKDRLTLLELLCRDQLKFLLNQQAYDWMAEFGLSNKWLDQIKSMLSINELTREDIDKLLQQLFPNPKKHRTNRRIILEATALAYYQQSPYYIQFLMSDDAPQFKKLAMHHALCWIHEGRHYKKLDPVSRLNQKILDNFLDKFWDYYAVLLEYKETPSKGKAEELSTQFDLLFDATTGYEGLDSRIAATKAKKNNLLLVLEHPFLPLHNNPAELGARVQARMRDINLQTITENGTKSKDTFATIVQTAKKLGVNIYQYIYDRVSKKFEMPSLADLILLKSQECQNSPA